MIRIFTIDKTASILKKVAFVCLAYIPFQMAHTQDRWVYDEVGYILKQGDTHLFFELDSKQSYRLSEERYALSVFANRRVRIRSQSAASDLITDYRLEVLGHFPGQHPQQTRHDPHTDWEMSLPTVTLDRPQSKQGFLVYDLLSGRLGLSDTPLQGGELHLQFLSVIPSLDMEVVRRLGFFVEAAVQLENSETDPPTAYLLDFEIIDNHTTSSPALLQSYFVSRQALYELESKQMFSTLKRSRPDDYDRYEDACSPYSWGHSFLHLGTRHIPSFLDDFPNRSLAPSLFFLLSQYNHFGRYIPFYPTAPPISRTSRDFFSGYLISQGAQLAQRYGIPFVARPSLYEGGGANLAAACVDLLTNQRSEIDLMQPVNLHFYEGRYAERYDSIRQAWKATTGEGAAAVHRRQQLRGQFIDLISRDPLITTLKRGGAALFNMVGNLAYLHPTNKFGNDPHRVIAHDRNQQAQAESDPNYYYSKLYYNGTFNAHVMVIVDFVPNFQDPFESIIELRDSNYPLQRSIVMPFHLFLDSMMIEPLFGLPRVVHRIAFVSFDRIEAIADSVAKDRAIDMYQKVCLAPGYRWIYDNNPQLNLRLLTSNRILALQHQIESQHSHSLSRQQLRWKRLAEDVRFIMLYEKLSLIYRKSPLHGRHYSATVLPWGIREPLVLAQATNGSIEALYHTIHSHRFHTAIGDRRYELITTADNLDGYRSDEWLRLSKRDFIRWALKVSVPELAFHDQIAGSARMQTVGK